MGLLSRIFGLGRGSPPRGAEEVAAVVARLAPWRDAHRRIAWRPRTEDGDGAADGSKFCGTAWLAPGESWPACGACRRPMQLFLQLDLAATARDTGAPLGAGLLQLFYCTGDGCDGSGWEPFGAASLARVVPGGAGGAVGLPLPAHPPFPPRHIVGWEPAEDHPSPEEYEELGLEQRWDRKGDRLTLIWAEGGVAVETADDVLERLVPTLGGDKLLGWPAWVQGVEYPSCPRCGARMELLFQLDSEDHVPYMFGDAGCGHVTRCPHHPDVVAFGWACG